MVNGLYFGMIGAVGAVRITTLGPDSFNGKEDPYCHAGTKSTLFAEGTEQYACCPAACTSCDDSDTCKNYFNNGEAEAADSDKCCLKFVVQNFGDKSCAASTAPCMMAAKTEVMAPPEVNAANDCPDGKESGSSVVDDFKSMAGQAQAEGAGDGNLGISSESDEDALGSENIAAGGAIDTAGDEVSTAVAGEDVADSTGDEVSTAVAGEDVEDSTDSTAVGQ